MIILFYAKDRILNTQKMYCSYIWSYFELLPSWFWWRSPVSKYIFQSMLYSATPYHTLTYKKGRSQTHLPHTHIFPVCCWIQSDSSSSFLPFLHPGSSYPPLQRHSPPTTPLCGEADAAALHTEFQAIWRLAAGVHDAAVHVAGAVAVVAHVVGAAAAAAGLRCAGAARGLRHHHVAKSQELAEQARQDAVDAAVWVKTPRGEAK